MARQKTSEKISFDDDLGDDFMSSWKPGEPLSAYLDFDDDEAAQKNSKKSFSLAKMDMDFDFDRGLNALSSFNIDMPDLDFPIRSVSKTRDSAKAEQKTRDNSKKGNSKFSFEFNGLDDFDLDDTLKTNKDPKGKTSLQNEKEDFGPPDSGGKYVGKKADSLNNLFEYEEHETSIGKHINPNNQKRDPIADELMAATSIDHNGSGRTQRGDPTSDRRRSLTFSSDDISQTKRTLSIHDSHEQTSMESDDCSSAKRRTSSYATSSANAAAAKIVSADEVADEKESLDDIEYKERTPIELDSGCIQLIPKQPESPKLSPKQENRKQHIEKLSEKKHEAETTSDTLPPSEVEAVKLNEIKSEISKRPGTPEEETPSQHRIPTKGLQESVGIRTLKTPAQSGICTKSRNSQKVKISNVSCHPQQKYNLENAEIVEKLPQNMQAKRKFDANIRPSDSLSHSDAINKLITDPEAESSDSLSSKKQCREPCASLPKNNIQSRNNLVLKSSLNLAPKRLLQDGQTPSKIEKTLTLQSSRSDMSVDPKRITVKSPTVPTQKDAAQMGVKALPGWLQKSSFSSASLQANKRHIDQVKSSSMTSSQEISLLGKSKSNAGNGLIGTGSTKTSSAGLSLLGRAKSTGLLREASEKAFKFNFEGKKDIVARINANSEARTEEDSKMEIKVQIPVTDKLSTDQVQANIKLEEQPVDAETLKDCFINTVPDKLSVDRAEAYTKSEIEKDGGGSTLKVIKEDDNHRHSRLAVATDSYGLKDLYGYGIAEEKAESYANRLDHLLKQLKEKQEEAMDLHVRALVINNTFLVLNNPADQDKISILFLHLKQT